MKYILFCIIFQCSFCLYGQTFNTPWVTDENNQFIQIRVEMDWSENGVLVSKEATSTPIGQQIENGALVLLGDFNLTDDILLKYGTNHIYFIPFNPELPITSLNILYGGTYDYGPIKYRFW